ncbi:MAG TPA: acyltransferase [Ktedonosporobacter sp.]|nr:acyltransferase [Ktedonosporobacter sp.]
MGNSKLSLSGLSASFCLYIQASSQSISQFLGDKKPKNAIPVLDGLRAIACLSVIMVHMNQLSNEFGIWKFHLDGIGAYISAASLFGESGVILFFLLSGFLLFLPYAKSLLFDSDWPSTRRFYTRRIFRILPGYYVALCLLLLFFNPLYLQTEHWHDLWLFLTFHMDFPPTFQKLNGPFWTLAIEFRFYMALPLLSWLMALVVRRGALHWRLTKLTLCLLLMLAWGFGTLYWGLFLARALPLALWFPHPIAETLTSYLFTAQKGKYFEVFSIGMLIAMLYVYRQNTPPCKHATHKRDLLHPLLFTLGLAGLAFMTLWRYNAQTLPLFNPSIPFWATYKDLFYPIGHAICYGLCMFALLHGPNWLRRPFAWTPLRWIGLISFSLYMWHYPFMTHFVWFSLSTYQKLGWNQFAQGCVFWLWTLLTAFPASIILYRLVEMPGIRLGELIC